MPHYSTTKYSDRFIKGYRKLQGALKKQVDKTVLRLIENPFHPALEAHSVKPASFYWEAYVNKGWRLIYRTEGPVLYIVDVVTHDGISRYDHDRLVR